MAALAVSLMVAVTFLAAAHDAMAAQTTNVSMVSVCGDPGMLLPPKILLEGWNFCNRCGRACSEGPRWADCVGPDGAQRVTPADNTAGLPLAQQNQSNCDAFAEQKERTLGGLCADPLGNATSFFWTAMLKSGAMNVSERGLLCGLWCANKVPDCNTGKVAADATVFLDNVVGPRTSGSPNWTDTNYEMRQPRVLHQWSTRDGSGGWQGSFYGTYDEQANLTALPTPSELIQSVLGPTAPGPSLEGTWLGQGDTRLVINVTQAPGAADFVASCTWGPTPGLPTPWYNQSGTVDAANQVAFHVNGHLDSGVVFPGEGRDADIVCWSASSWWCRDTLCNATARCAQLPPAAAISTYFGMEWVTRGGRRVHRHILRTGYDLGWLMLYTGPEAATGLKGGYEWDGRGQYAPTPQSTTRNASSWNATWGPMPPNNFQVVQWVNITRWPGGPGFYFLNMGGCWKDAGVECDGDITTDVTRYLLFQLPSPSAPAAGASVDRCGPSAAGRALCPPFHRYRNGTVVPLGDPAFPFRAYHSASSRARALAAGGNFTCKHDCWSNPCDQDWVRIEPSPEWAEYGFPASVADAMLPTKWTMDVGAVTAQVSSLFSGLTPPVLQWTTLNIGPEMQGGPGAVAIWEVAESDVLIEAGSQ